MECKILISLQCTFHQNKNDFYLLENSSNRKKKIKRINKLVVNQASIFSRIILMAKGDETVYWMDHLSVEMSE